MSEYFVDSLFAEQQESKLAIPQRNEVASFVEDLLSFLFPMIPPKNKEALGLEWKQLRDKLGQILKPFKSEKLFPSQIRDDFFNKIPNVYETLKKDIEAVLSFDPASHCKEEVIATYPGFFAVAIYRIAHLIYDMKVPILPRMMTEYAHAKTGIDINPGAIIGESFFIDHGTGIVIGETTVIGSNVKMYQGVTLGALNVRKELAKKKRHPTVEDEVIIYANATILGGETIIGRSSVIGGNTFITKSVKPYSIVLPEGNKSRIISSMEEKND